MDKSYLSKEGIRELTLQYCKDHSLTPDKIRGYTYHLERFLKTRDYLIGIPQFLEKNNVLEIGGYDVISKIIRTDFPENIYSNTSFELRDAFPLQDNSYDFILNLEVIEHISEPDCNWKQSFSFYGVKHLLQECYRVLKPGGVMLLTTPNSLSYTIMQRIFEQQPPWLYFLHYKEYTLNQVKELLEEAGFKINFIKTEYVYTTQDKHSYLQDFLNKQGFSNLERGDIIFALVKKEG